MGFKKSLLPTVKCPTLTNPATRPDIKIIQFMIFSPVFVIRSYLKISSSSWETEEISSKGALKLEVPKMPKMI
jgi:hypothetical protein